MKKRELEKFVKVFEPQFFGLGISFAADINVAYDIWLAAIEDFVKNEKDFASYVNQRVDYEGKQVLKNFFYERMFSYIYKQGIEVVLKSQISVDPTALNPEYLDFYSIDPVVRGMLYLRASTRISMKTILRFAEQATGFSSHQLQAKLNSARDWLASKSGKSFSVDNAGKDQYCIHSNKILAHHDRSLTDPLHEFLDIHIERCDLCRSLQQEMINKLSYIESELPYFDHRELGAEKLYKTRTYFIKQLSKKRSYLDMMHL